MSTQLIEGTPLKLTIHNSGFWQVTIDSPPLNLFGPELLTGLEEVVKRMQSSPDLRVIVFDSAIPDYFIAHFDISNGSELLARKTAPKTSMEHMEASRAAFIKANLRLERQPVSQKLKAWGIQQDGDFERNVGQYLNHISE